MTRWLSGIASILFGGFIYFITLNDLVLAIIPALLLMAVTFVGGQPFKASTRGERMPFWAFVFLFLLAGLGYVMPDRFMYALPLGCAAAAVAFVLLSVRGKNSIPQAG